MANRMCRNKRCKRPLPKRYKHKYCENCRNQRIKRIKDAGKAVAGVAVLIGGTALTIITRGKFNTRN